MINVVLGLIIVAIVGAEILYIRKEKKAVSSASDARMLKPAVGTAMGVMEVVEQNKK